MDKVKSKRSILPGFIENAIKIKIFIAISAYVLVVMAGKKLKITNALYGIVQ